MGARILKGLPAALQAHFRTDSSIGYVRIVYVAFSEDRRAELYPRHPTVTVTQDCRELACVFVICTERVSSDRNNND